MFGFTSYYLVGLLGLLVAIGWGVSRCLLRHILDRRSLVEWTRQRGGRIVRSGYFHGLTICFQARSQEVCLWLLPMRCWRQPQLQLTVPWPTGKHVMSLRPMNALSRIVTVYPRRHHEPWGHGYQLYTHHPAWARKLLGGGVSSSLRRMNALLDKRRCDLHLEHEQFRLRFRVPVDASNQLCQLIELGLDLGDQLGLQERGEITLSNRVESRPETELHCPVCSGALEHGIVYCRLCGAPHHLDCWRYLGRCSLFGCQGTHYRQRHRKWWR